MWWSRLLRFGQMATIDYCLERYLLSAQIQTQTRCGLVLMHIQKSIQNAAVTITQN